MDDLVDNNLPIDPIKQDKGEVFTLEALEATEKADAELEALDEIADFYIENFDAIADGEVNTESLWEDYHEQFDNVEDDVIPKSESDFPNLSPTDPLLEATQNADAELEALDEIADFYVDNFDAIADGEVSTEPLWEDYQEEFGRQKSEGQIIRNKDNSDDFTAVDDNDGNQPDGDDLITIHPDNKGPEYLPNPEVEPYSIENPEGGSPEPPEGWAPGGPEGGY